MHWRVFHCIRVFIANSLKAAYFKIFAEQVTRHSWQKAIVVITRRAHYLHDYIHILFNIFTTIFLFYTLLLFQMSLYPTDDMWARLGGEIWNYRKKIWGRLVFHVFSSKGFFFIGVTRLFFITKLRKPIQTVISLIW